MRLSKFPRKLVQQANIDSLRLSFLYRTKTILASPANDIESSNHVFERSTDEPTEVNYDPSGADSPTDPQRDGQLQQEAYDGRNSHSYARGASSRYHDSGRTSSRRRSGVTRSPLDKQTERTPNVPFEKLPNATERLEGSTMTWGELKRFEKLFKLGVSGKALDKKRDRSPSGDSQLLDQGRATNRPKPEFPDLLKPLAEEAAMLRAQAESSLEAADRRQDLSVKADEETQEYLAEVKQLMNQASYDIELRGVLQDQVYSKIKALELRDDVDVEARLQAAMTEEKLRDFQLLTDTLPTILLHYMRLVESSFPGSSLGLNLMPSLKELGSSAFALGATTDLFNQHMRLLFKQYTDVDGINNTLTEMDKEVYEFNFGTKQLLEMIFRHANASKRGQNGPGLQALWLTDRKARAMVKLTRWKEVVDERLTAAVMKQAMAKAAERAGDELVVE